MSCTRRLANSTHTPPSRQQQGFSSRHRIRRTEKKHRWAQRFGPDSARWRHPSPKTTPTSPPLVPSSWEPPAMYLQGTQGLVLWPRSLTKHGLSSKGRYAAEANVQVPPSVAGPCCAAPPIGCQTYTAPANLAPSPLGFFLFSHPPSRRTCPEPFGKPFPGRRVAV